MDELIHKIKMQILTRISKAVDSDKSFTPDALHTLADILIAFEKKDNSASDKDGVIVGVNENV